MTSRLDVYVGGLQYSRLINKQYGAKRLTALANEFAASTMELISKTLGQEKAEPKEAAKQKSINLKSSTRLTCKDYSNDFESSEFE